MRPSKRMLRRSFRALTGVAACLLIAPRASVGGVILFEDHFDVGMSPEWVSIAPSQWVEDGWLHTQDQVSDTQRGSAAVVHDGDMSWTDYELSLWVDPLIANTVEDPWEFADVFFRTRDCFWGSDGPKVNGYVLHFHGPDCLEDPGYLYLQHRIPGGTSYYLAVLPDVVGSDPMDVLVLLNGPRIRVSIDGNELIDVIDPDPYLYGGIGIGVGWEAHARFDDVVVPEAGTLSVITLAGLLIARRRR